MFLKQELREESNELKSSHKEIEALSKSILTFLGEVHKPSAEAIQAKVDKLVEQQSKWVPLKQIFIITPFSSPTLHYCETQQVQGPNQIGFGTHYTVCLIVRDV